VTFRRVGSSYMVRLFKGEEKIDTLKGFLRKYGITAGTVSGIGATDDVTIGYFDPEKKEYQKKTFQGDFEILNLSGNVTMLDGEPLLHLHILLGDREYRVSGGHLFSANVSVTCEVFVKGLDTIIHREMDPETGLNLMKL